MEFLAFSIFTFVCGVIPTLSLPTEKFVETTTEIDVSLYKLPDEFDPETDRDAVLFRRLAHSHPTGGNFRTRAGNHFSRRGNSLETFAKHPDPKSVKKPHRYSDEPAPSFRIMDVIEKNQLGLENEKPESDTYFEPFVSRAEKKAQHQSLDWWLPKTGLHPQLVLYIFGSSPVYQRTEDSFTDDYDKVRYLEKRSLGKTKREVTEAPDNDLKLLKKYLRTGRPQERENMAAGLWEKVKNFFAGFGDTISLMQSNSKVVYERLKAQYNTFIDSDNVRMHNDVRQIMKIVSNLFVTMKSDLLNMMDSVKLDIMTSPSILNYMTNMGHQSLTGELTNADDAMEELSQLVKKNMNNVLDKWMDTWEARFSQAISGTPSE